jgi:hypothetical protein
MNVSKKVFVSSILASGLLFGAVGVYAADGVTLVKAYLNSTIKFTLNGSSWTPKDASGNKISPLVYNGSTYLPAKAVGEALNAEVLWDGNSKTVVISTVSGENNAGEPYNDASPKPPASTPAPQQSNAPAGVISLPANHDLKASGEKNKSVALAFIQAYGNALSSGSTTGIDALIDKYIADDVNDYNMGYKKRAKEHTSKILLAETKANDSQTIAKYAGILKNATINDVTFGTTYSDKGSAYTTLQYSIELPGFLSSSFSVFLEFDLDKKTNTYMLTAANM